jgi:CheY-like chemotaxis protein
MLTNGLTMLGLTTPPRTAASPARSTTTQTVMVVNGNDAVMTLLETVLDAGPYDVVLVESTAHAYSQVKRVRPNLVILCTRMEEMAGFQVLSMLKLDKDTRSIPVLTCTTECDADGAAGEESSPSSPEAQPFRVEPLPRMN